MVLSALLPLCFPISSEAAECGYIAIIHLQSPSILVRSVLDALTRPLVVNTGEKGWHKLTQVILLSDSGT
jgi:hypothetical protein